MKISEQIDEGFKKSKKEEKRRAYIGASAIGGACEAAVAFGFRAYPETPITPKTQRIFRDGHRIEWDVVKDLQQAGINVLPKDPMSGNQWEFKEMGGHVVGHADGLIEDSKTPTLLEIKSMNQQKWKDFKSKGVKFSHPHYFSQVQFMMGLSGFEQTHFVSYNKNTSEYADELIDFDEFHYLSLVERAERIMRGDAQKISDNPDDWRCRFCFKSGACWDGELPTARSMRTCGNSIALKDGTWSCKNDCKETCKKWTPYIPKDKQGSST